jgi:hypothetical protein
LYKTGKEMDKYPKLRKCLMVGIIFLFLGIALVTTINASSVIKNIDKVNTETYPEYHLCRLNISGKGHWGYFPGGYYWNLSEGQVSIKSLFSTTRDENGKIIHFSLFDKYLTSGPSYGYIDRFKGTMSNEPFEIHGFALWAWPL